MLFFASILHLGKTLYQMKRVTYLLFMILALAFSAFAQNGPTAYIANEYRTLSNGAFNEAGLENQATIIFNSGLNQISVECNNGFFLDFVGNQTLFTITNRQVLRGGMQVVYETTEDIVIQQNFMGGDIIFTSRQENPQQHYFIFKKAKPTN